VCGTLNQRATVPDACSKLVRMSVLVDVVAGLARRRSLSARRRSSLTNTSRRNPSLRGSKLAQPDSSNNLISPELVQAEAEAAAGAKAQEPSPPEEGPEPDLVFRLEEWIDDRNPGLGRQVSTIANQANRHPWSSAQGTLAHHPGRKW
jgi:hypothetical protein